MKNKREKKCVDANRYLPDLKTKFLFFFFFFFFFFFKKTFSFHVKRCFVGGGKKSCLIFLCVVLKMSCFKRVESEETLDISGPIQDGGAAAAEEEGGFALVMRNWGERGITAKQLNVKKGDVIKVQMTFCFYVLLCFLLKYTYINFAAGGRTLSHRIVAWRIERRKGYFRQQVHGRLQC